MFASTISSKGQITVPIEIRLRLGLKEGDRVEFVSENGRIIIRPARVQQNPFESKRSSNRRLAFPAQLCSCCVY